MNIVWVFLGGGLGSVARYLVSRGSVLIYSGDFPLGTLLSNAVACLLLGVFVYLLPLRAEQTWLHPLLIIGFCGGFSTFSTFSGETFNLINNQQWGYAVANILISVISGIGLIYFVQKISN